MCPYFGGGVVVAGGVGGVVAVDGLLEDDGPVIELSVPAPVLALL